jgi:transcriptional regulator with XRE-family HTH domain
MKKAIPFSDEIRAAITHSGLTRYRICKQVGMQESSMTRFLRGRGGLSLETIDRIAALLDLHVSAGTARRPEGTAGPNTT